MNHSIITYFTYYQIICQLISQINQFRQKVQKNQFLITLFWLYQDSPKKSTSFYIRKKGIYLSLYSRYWQNDCVDNFAGAFWKDCEMSQLQDSCCCCSATTRYSGISMCFVHVRFSRHKFDVAAHALVWGEAVLCDVSLQVICFTFL